MEEVKAKINPPMASEPPPSPPPSVVLEKPGEKSQFPAPFPAKPRPKISLIVILIILAILIWLGVGFLYLQNSKLKKGAESKPTNHSVALTPPASGPTATPEAKLKTYKSSVIPLEVQLPSDWKMSESTVPALGDQRSITFESSDFALEGSQVASGYEFRVGPVSNLTKKYKTFEDFTKVENKDGKGEIITINGIQWIKFPTSAQTLVIDSPLTVALYFSDDEKDQAPSLFSQILSTFKFSD
jgi:hypothetical protein